MKQRLQIAAVALIASGLVWWSLASPLRGRWVGEFDGSVSGTVEFRIGVRGTSARGTMNGQTSSGEPFRADLEGQVGGGRLRATFVGSSRGGPLGIQFRGILESDLDPAGREPAAGTWRCALERAGQVIGEPLEGTFEVRRRRNQAPEG